MENKEKDSSRKPNKNLTLVLVGAVLVVAVLIIIVAMQKDKEGSSGLTGTKQPGKTDKTVLVDEEGVAIPDASVSFDDKNLEEVQIQGVGSAKVVIPGANPITADNVVITETGQVADNAGMVMGDNSPKQTGFLNVDEIPATVVKLNVGNGKFSPSSFTATAGAPTTFSLTGVDEYSHMISFEDPALAAVAILVGPGQTKAITFNAPAEPGTYTFFCASPGHREKGEVGQMIVVR